MKKIVIIIALITLILMKIYYEENLKPVFNEEYDRLILDRGKNMNLEEGDIVLSNNHLVGLVTEVLENESVVTLITDIHSNLAVKIGNIYGVISSYEDGYLIVNNVKNEEILLGSDVFTSGISYVYPENIYVGKVKEVFLDKIIIETNVDFNNLDIIKR